ncbi:MAG: PTS sugar transporter subunit IIA [Caldisericaceae bacterium]
MAHEIVDKQWGLNRLFMKSSILLNFRATDSEDKIKIGCDLQVKISSVTETYLKLMKSYLKKYGLYFVIFRRFTLLHFKEKNNSFRSLVVGFIRLRKPVYFRHPAKDSVYLALALAMPADKSNLDLLARLGSFLIINKTEFMRSRTKREIHDLLSLLFCNHRTQEMANNCERVMII